MPWVGLVLGGFFLIVVLANYKRQSPELRLQYSWGTVGLGYLIFLGIAIPALWGIRATGPDILLRCLSDRATAIGTLVFVPITIGIGIMAWSVIRGRLSANWSTIRFLTVFLGSAVLLRLTYALMLDVEAVSDFGTMWSIAGQTRENGLFELRAETPMARRIVPYLLPLVKLFGTSPYVYKVANVIAFALSAWMVFVLARRWFGERSARAALILLIGVPETFFANVIPSHDIPGVLYLLLGLLLIDTLISSENLSFWKSLGLSIALGIVALLFDVQRSTAVFLLISMIAVAIISAEKVLIKSELPFREICTKWRATIVFWSVFIFIIPVCIHHFGYIALLDTGVLADSRSAHNNKKVPWFLANSDSWGDGTWGYAHRTYYLYYEGMPSAPKAWDGKSQAKILSDIYYNPQERIVNFIRKARRLYSLGTQGNFYYVDKIIQPTSLLKGDVIRRVLNAWTRVYTSLFLTALIAACFFFSISKMSPSRHLPSIVFVTSLSLVLLLFGENQPRYLYPIWFIFPILAISAYNSILTKSARKTKIRHLVKAIWQKALVYVACTIILFGALQTVGYASDSRMLDFRQWKDPHSNFELPDGFLPSIQSPFQGQRAFQLMLGYPNIPKKGDIVSVSKTYRFDNNRPRTFSVFVVNQNHEKDILAKVQGFWVVISINGKDLRRFPLTAAHAAQYVSIPNIVPKDGEISIEIGLEAGNTIIGKSSLARFEFAQLIKQ